MKIRGTYITDNIIIDIGLLAVRHWAAHISTALSTCGNKADSLINTLKCLVTATNLVRKKYTSNGIIYILKAGLKSKQDNWYIHALVEVSAFFIVAIMYMQVLESLGDTS